MIDVIKESPAENAPVIGVAANPEDKARWAYITEWHVEPQSDDRRPVSGSVSAGTSSLSAGRSSARRQHQAMFKAWSQSRHD